MAKSREELKEVRKQMIDQMEEKLHESWSSEEDNLFYYHRSEDRIVLSHALFWVMSQSLGTGDGYLFHRKTKSVIINS